MSNLPRHTHTSVESSGIDHQMTLGLLAFAAKVRLDFKSDLLFLSIASREFDTKYQSKFRGDFKVNLSDW
jgi:hypothetical protein